MRGSSNALICTRSLRYAMERSTRRKETGTNVRRHRFILATIPSPPLWASCICAKRPSNGMGLASCFEKNRSNFKAHAMPICKPRGGACSSHRRNRAMPFARDYQGNCKTYSLTAFFFCSCSSLFRQLPRLRLALWHGLCSNMNQLQPTSGTPMSEEERSQIHSLEWDHEHSCLSRSRHF